MMIGINWTSPVHLNVIKNLLSEGIADFCEILIDNFLHLSPLKIQDELGEFPIAFHIMNSHFIERDTLELIGLGKYINDWIKIVKPIYVSDHLAKFSEGGRSLPIVAELDYMSSLPQVKKKVSEWQEILDSQIAFENFPSVLDVEGQQLSFFGSIMEDTKAKLLFDYSNAIVAEENGCTSALFWLPLISNAENFHVAGYRMSDTTPAIAIDSHDVIINQKTLDFLKNSSSHLSAMGNKTLVVERDSDIDFSLWKSEILTVKSIFYD